MGKVRETSKSNTGSTKEKIHSAESSKKEVKSNILKSKKEVQSKQRQLKNEEKKEPKGQVKGGLEEIDDLFNTAAKAKKAEKVEQIKAASNNSKNTHTNSSRQNPVKMKCNFDRSDIAKLQNSSNSTCAWASDGLGGVFNAEGYTGRKESNSGYKIYKAHLFNKKGFGNTKDCPFDCQCCFI